MGQYESKVSREVRPHLTRLLRPARWIKIAQGPYSEAGISDNLACVRGLFVAVEMKIVNRRNRKKELPTPKQQQFIDDVNACGGVAFHYVYDPNRVNYEQAAQEIAQRIIDTIKERRKNGSGSKQNLS